MTPTLLTHLKPPNVVARRAIPLTLSLLTGRRRAADATRRPRPCDAAAWDDIPRRIPSRGRVGWFRYTGRKPINLIPVPPVVPPAAHDLAGPAARGSECGHIPDSIDDHIDDHIDGHPARP